MKLSAASSTSTSTPRRCASAINACVDSSKFDVSIKIVIPLLAPPAMVMVAPAGETRRILRAPFSMTYRLPAPSTAMP